VSTELELVGRHTGCHAFHAVQEVGCASVMAASIIGTGNINNELTDTKEFTAKNKMVGYQSAETKLQRKMVFKTHIKQCTSFCVGHRPMICRRCSC